MLKRTNEEGRQSLWGFPRPEITWRCYCHENNSRFAFLLVDFKDLNGEQALEPSLKRPQYLHVVFSDPKICGLSGSNNGSTSGPEFASFLMELVNLDSQGHPFNHFSYDDSGECLRSQTFT